MQPEPIHIEPDAWCKWCGDPLPEFEERHWKREFCKRGCKDAYRNDQGRERRAAARAGKTCAHCGGTFDGNRPDHVYCSQKCYGRARYRRELSRKE